MGIPDDADLRAGCEEVQPTSNRSCRLRTTSRGQGPESNFLVTSPVSYHGNPRGQLPSGITGTGSLVGPPASSRPSSSQAMPSPSASPRLKGNTGMLRTPVMQSIPEFGLNVESLPSSSPSLGLGLGLGLGVPMPPPLPPPLPPPPRKMPPRRRWLAAFNHSTGVDSVISGAELALEEGLAASQA